jgi:hypothetical protein
MNRFLIIALIAAISLIFSCKSTNNKENMLTGSWRIENIEMNREMTESEKANFNLYLSQLKETGYFTFKNDHKFESFYNEELSKGTWELAGNGQQLITIPDESEADTVKIAELNSQSLILLSESDGVTTKIIMKKQK